MRYAAVGGYPSDVQLGDDAQTSVGIRRHLLRIDMGAQTRTLHNLRPKIPR